MHVSTFSLSSLGWTPFFAAAFQPFAEQGFTPGRVILESRELYRLASAQGELWAEPTGALRYRAESRADLPAVGDWVAFRDSGGDSPAILHAILPRRGALVRRAAGRRTEEQIVGANVDTVFLLSSLNQDLNLRRLERYLAIVREGGARPVIVLSKSDLAAAADAALAAVASVAPGIPLQRLSALTGEGLDELGPYLREGQTVALLGSSGVGKSTLVNRLLGEERQAVREIRDRDDRGRHATTRRELILLPGGGLLLDTPGMRELGVWAESSALAEVFGEIAELGAQCRFTDCRHRGEPGCAVTAAIARGELDAERLASLHKLEKEESYLSDRLQGGAAFAERKRWKAVHARLKKGKPIP